MNCAVYVASPTTGTTSGDQEPLNVYEYCAVAVFVGIAHVYVGISPYATCSVFNVPPFQSIQVIVYLFTVESNCAVYVISPVTDEIVGDHVSLNVYVYCAVAVFVGIAHVYAGVSPYDTVSVHITMSFQSFHVIVYSFTVESNCAVYVISPVTDEIDGDQVLLNV